MKRKHYITIIVLVVLVLIAVTQRRMKQVSVENLKDISWESVQSLDFEYESMYDQETFAYGVLAFDVNDEEHVKKESFSLYLNRSLAKHFVIKKLAATYPEFGYSDDLLAYSLNDESISEALTDTNVGHFPISDAMAKKMASLIVNNEGCGIVVHYDGKTYDISAWDGSIHESADYMYVKSLRKEDE